MDQTSSGKAFEYAFLHTIYETLNEIQNVVVIQSDPLITARQSFESMDESSKLQLTRAAAAGYRVIKQLEPQLENPNGNDPLYLSIQADSAGMKGDVRDLITMRIQNGWEIGISCKRNHDAVKHSRLSATIDFGEKWLGIPCSSEYFEENSELYARLSIAKENHKLWSEIDEKVDTVYKPILNAFMREFKKLDELNPGQVPARLITYLLGTNDFYKVITEDANKVTRVQAYNIFGTLNKQSGLVRSITRVPQLVLPTRIFNIDYKVGSDNTIEITCDNGWSVSLRLHNASSRVEPSLKFDVRLIGQPPALYSQHAPW